MLNEAGRRWIGDRGLSAETAERLGLATVNRGGGDWIEIPYFRNGKRLNTKYRRLDEKQHSQDPDGAKLVWNEDSLREPEFGGPVIITEGEFDALAAIEAGFERVVSVPDGAPSEELGDRETSKYDYVPALLELLKGEREIVIAADGDEKGAHLLQDLTRRLGRSRCKYVRYPRGKDLNDLLELGGKIAVEMAIETAQWMEIDGLYKLSEMPPEPKLTIWKPRITPALDDRLSICPEHFSVWTGIPGHGKSTLLKAVMFNLAQLWDLRIAVFAGEESAKRDFREDCAAYLAGRHPDELHPADWRAADDFLERHFSFIVPSYNDTLDIDWMLEKAAAAVVRHGVRICAFDPWSKLDHEWDRNSSETQYTSQVIKLFQRFARKFHVHVALVAHTMKQRRDAKGRYEVPGGYDISGSAHFFNHPQLGVTVHRDHEAGENVSLVRVWKVKRHREMGRPGDVRLFFDPATGRYSHFDESMLDVRDSTPAPDDDLPFG